MRPSGTVRVEAELRADVGRHESGEREGIGKALIEGSLPDVVAVIEGLGAFALHLHHQFDVPSHRSHRLTLVGIGIVAPKRVGISSAQPLRVVALKRIVRRCLIGQGVRNNVSIVQPSEQIDRIAEPADRNRFTRTRRRNRSIDRLIEIFVDLIEVSIVLLLQTLPAHLAMRHVPSFIVIASGWAPPIPPQPAVTFSVPASVPPKCCRAALGVGLMRCPAGCPGCRCRSMSRPSSGQTSSAPWLPVHRIVPGSPNGAQDSSWR